MDDTPQTPAKGHLAARLKSAAQALGCNLSTAQRQHLLDYLALLQQWNKVYNLTAVRDPGEMLTLHVLDSLAVLGPLRHWLAQRGSAPEDKPVRLLDVGSGAGLPGVVLAICCPDLAVTCVDTVGKKAAFIQQVAVTLKLPNLTGVHARVESLAERYDVVCSRAFSSLAEFTAGSWMALAQDGVWLAMKGKIPMEEQSALPETVEVFHVEPLTVPGLQAERCIVWLRKK